MITADYFKPVVSHAIPVRLVSDADFSDQKSCALFALGSFPYEETTDKGVVVLVTGTNIQIVRCKDFFSEYCHPGGRIVRLQELAAFKAEEGLDPVQVGSSQQRHYIRGFFIKRDFAEQAFISRSALPLDEAANAFTETVFEIAQELQQDLQIEKNKMMEAKNASNPEGKPSILIEEFEPTRYWAWSAFVGFTHEIEKSPAIDFSGALSRFSLEKILDRMIAGTEPYFVPDEVKKPVRNDPERKPSKEMPAVA